MRKMKINTNKLILNKLRITAYIVKNERITKERKYELTN